MRIGATIFLTDRTIPITTLARELEDRGFHALYVPEHTHIPISRSTPAPLGEPLPEEYRRVLDPFTALASAATVTSALRIGTSVCLVAEHDAIALAKTVATLDHLFPGRFDFGVGFGWNREEMADHGVDFARRHHVVRERIAAMRTLWASEPMGFRGESVAFEPSWAYPKPASVPVLIGGMGGPRLLTHIAEYADGWMPMGGSGLRKRIPELFARAEAVGRDPAELRIVPVGSRLTPGKLEYFETLGIAEIAIGLPSGTADEVLPELDGYAKYLEA